MEEPAVEVRRSRRRRRTVTAYREGGRVVVCLPGSFTKEQERHWVSTMLDKIAAQEHRRRPSDDQLMRRADELNRRYLDGRADPASISWSSDQTTRWGSCTPTNGTIRISDRLKGLPGWVLDYVLVHELAHLLISTHGPEFWALVDRYPRSQRARGFLDGLAYSTSNTVPD